MGLLVQRAPAVGGEQARAFFLLESVDCRGHAEEAFGPQEVAAAGPTHPARQADVVVEYRMGGTRRETEVLASPFGVEARGHGDRLDQRRLAASVRTHEEVTLRVKLERVEGPDRRDGEGVGAEVRDLLPEQGRRAQETGLCTIHEQDDRARLGPSVTCNYEEAAAPRPAPFVAGLPQPGRGAQGTARATWHDQLNCSPRCPVNRGRRTMSSVYS